MSVLKKIGSRVGRATVLAATTVGLTLGLATAPASAAPAQGDVYLSIGWIGPATYQVTVGGVFHMSEYDAHGYINNLATGSRAANGAGPGGIYYHLTGDDPGTSSDRDVWVTQFYAGKSLPGQRAGGYLYAASDGIHFQQQFVVPGSALNEDGTTWYGSAQEDEIFADATFIDGDNGARVTYSNVVVSYF